MSIIFRKFYKKKPDVEYWIPIRYVNITYDFQLSSPGITKFKRKEKEFLIHLIHKINRHFIHSMFFANKITAITIHQLKILIKNNFS